MISKAVRLVRIPQGAHQADDFEVADAEVPEPDEGLVGLVGLLGLVGLVGLVGRTLVRRGGL